MNNCFCKGNERCERGWIWCDTYLFISRISLTTERNSGVFAIEKSYWWYLVFVSKFWKGMAAGIIIGQIANIISSNRLFRFQEHSNKKSVEIDKIFLFYLYLVEFLLFMSPGKLNFISWNESPR